MELCEVGGGGEGLLQFTFSTELDVGGFSFLFAAFFCISCRKSGLAYLGKVAAAASTAPLLPYYCTTVGNVLKFTSYKAMKNIHHIY